MTGHDDLFVQHLIAAIGLSLYVYRAWPLLAISDSSTEGVYQPVGDTSGIVFVRYGPEDSLDQYLGKLGGMFTEVSMLSDAAQTVSGHAARRVTVRMVSQPREMYRDEPGRGITHKALPAARTVLTVIGFSNRDIPILAGYRIPEESIESYRSRVEYMLNSIATF